MAAYLTLSFALIISLGAQRSLAQGLNDPTRLRRKFSADPRTGTSPQRARRPRKS